LFTHVSLYFVHTLLIVSAIYSHTLLMLIFNCLLFWCYITLLFSQRSKILYDPCMIPHLSIVCLLFAYNYIVSFCNHCIWFVTVIIYIPLFLRIMTHLSFLLALSYNYFLNIDVWLRPWLLLCTVIARTLLLSDITTFIIGASFWDECFF